MDNKLIVIVEDLFSQMRLNAAGFSVVALLGTTLSEDQFLKLAAHSDAQIFIWLDLDAVNKAVKLQRRLSSVFERVHVVRTSLEPKHLSTKEIKQHLLATRIEKTLEDQHVETRTADQPQEGTVSTSSQATTADDAQSSGT